jgi:hypothetical protein
LTILRGASIVASIEHTPWAPALAKMRMPGSNIPMYLSVAEGNLKVAALDLLNPETSLKLATEIIRRHSLSNDMQALLITSNRAPFKMAKSEDS